MRLHCCLEKEQAGRSVGVRSYFITLVVDRLRHFRYEWNYISEKFHHSPYTHIS